MAKEPTMDETFSLAMDVATPVHPERRFWLLSTGATGCALSRHDART
jgi:hypothetical protein